MSLKEVKAEELVKVSGRFQKLKKMTQEKQPLNKLSESLNALLMLRDRTLNQIM